MDLKEKIRVIEDFPKEGIIFRDITTALKDAETLRVIVDYLCEQFKDEKIDYIAGIESRGFILGMPMAYKMGIGFVPEPFARERIAKKEIFEIPLKNPLPTQDICLVCREGVPHSIACTAFMNLLKRDTIDFSKGESEGKKGVEISDSI